MKKILLPIAILLFATLGTFAQSIDNSFFDHVSYIGAFDGTNDWTSGWTEWDPVNKTYADATTTKGNSQFSYADGLHITASETWSGVIKLDGWVYVDAGATLTIQAGTVIRGTEKSALIVQRGGKINAVGTSSSPIVFTSNLAAGLRTTSCWGGVVLCGYATNNISGGVGTAEGGISAQYGGSDDYDNSGVMQYCRIEFAGYEVATSSEINGLTLYSIGNSTTIDHIQVSYSGDDAYEWFGGTVNAKYLISYKTEDDDFDTDNGYRGMVQYGVTLRINDIVDTDAANAFESDNDASGSTSTPYTHAVFSNVSAFGPAITSTNPSELATKHADGSTMRLRRNTRLQIYNSALMGYGKGLRLESDKSQTAALSDSLTVQYTMMAGIRGDDFIQDASATVMTSTTMGEWFKASARHNSVYDASSDLMIADAYNYTSPNFQPQSGSPLLNASYWATSSSNTVSLVSAGLKAYPNPFQGTTTISVNLDNSAKVSIVVYNSMGVKVSEIYSGTASTGVNEFSFDATTLSKGIYYGIVTVGKSKYSVKMMAR